MMRLYTDVFFLILGFPNLPCTQVYTKTKPFQTGYNENKKLYDRQTKMSGKTEWWCKISFCVCTFCRKLSKKKLLNYFFNAANRVINAFLFYFYFIIIFLISDFKKKIIFFFIGVRIYTSSAIVFEISLGWQNVKCLKKMTYNQYFAYARVHIQPQYSYANKQSPRMDAHTHTHTLILHK